MRWFEQMSVTTRGLNHFLSYGVSGMAISDRPSLHAGMQVFTLIRISNQVESQLELGIATSRMPQTRGNKPGQYATGSRCSLADLLQRFHLMNQR